MFISPKELFDMAVMTAVVGFIFMDLFKKPVENYDPLIHYKAGFNWNDFLFACLVVAPAIIFHELSHKFFALSYGLNATFQAAYFFLGLGLMMKLMRFGFIFFVPAYVSIIGRATPLQFGMIAFAGPLMNLILWVGTLFVLKKNMVKRKYVPAVLLTSKINMFLFIFNMLPIPGFDGFQVFRGLLGAIF
jgi:Zn-dependent protease